ELGQAEVLGDLLANPLVVRERIHATRDVQAEEKPLKRAVEPVERLKVQVSTDEPRNAREVVVEYEPARSRQSPVSQRVVVERKPAGGEAFEAIAVRIERHG